MVQQHQCLGVAHPHHHNSDNLSSSNVKQTKRMWYYVLQCLLQLLRLVLVLLNSITKTFLHQVVYHIGGETCVLPLVCRLKLFTRSRWTD